MTAGLIRLTLVSLALLGLAALVRFAAWPVVHITLAAPPDGAPAAASADVGVRVGSESIAAVVSRDPFRVGRRPALIAYDPVRLAEQLAPVAPKPVLVLVGVLSGADPSAVVEGFPGVEGSRVVRVGDIVAGLRIKQIANNRVVIAGMDTTWVLDVKEPWK